MRGELETGTDCYILTPSSSDHSSTSFAFWLGCSTVGHWRPKPSVWSWFSLCWHPISNSNWNWPKPYVAPGNIIILRSPASWERTHLPPSPLNHGSLRAQNPVCRWLSFRHLVSNWLQLQLELTQAVCGTWLYNWQTSTCFRCSSAYLHRCISWLTARSWVNI